MTGEARAGREGGWPGTAALSGLLKKKTHKIRSNRL